MEGSNLDNTAIAYGEGVNVLSAKSRSIGQLSKFNVAMYAGCRQGGSEDEESTVTAMIKTSSVPCCHLYKWGFLSLNNRCAYAQGVMNALQVGYNWNVRILGR